MTAFPADDRLLLDANGRIDHDLTCIDCGYNLRTALPTDDCPECGKPIAESVRGDLLVLSCLSWLRKVRQGLTVYLVMILSVVLCFVAFTVITPFIISFYAGYLWIYLIFLIPMTIGLAGVWLMTTAEPGSITPRREKPERMRRLARLFTVISYLWGAALLIISAGSFSLDWQTTQSLSLLNDAISLAGTFTLLAYAASLAARIPLARLIRQTQIVKWGVTISTIVMLVGGVMGFVATQQNLNQASSSQNASPSASAQPVGSPQVSSYTQPNGNTVTTTTTNYSNGAVSVEVVTTDPSGQVIAQSVNTTATAFSWSGYLSPGMIFIWATQAIGGIGQIVFSIWALVLLFWYRSRLKRAITEAAQIVQRNDNPAPA